MARDSEKRKAPNRAENPAPRDRDEDADARGDRVGEFLRGIYDEVLAERVPDSFEDLLRKLG